MDERRLPIGVDARWKGTDADGAAGGEATKRGAMTAIDNVWTHGVPFKTGFQCHYCNEKYLGGGATRFREHLAGIIGNVKPCPKVPKDVRECLQESRAEGKRARAVNKARKKRIEDEIARSVGVDVRDYGDDIPNDEEGQLQFALRRSLHETSIRHIASSSCGAKQTRIDAVFHKQIPSKRQAHFDIDLARSRGAVQPRINVALSPDLKDKIGKAWSKFFQANSVPGRKANCPYFRAAYKLTQQLGEGVPCPRGEAMDGPYLESNFEELEHEAKECEKDWDQYKVTLMCDSWTGDNGESFINFMVYCNEKLLFHKTVNATGKTQNSSFLYDCIKEVIVEDIGVDRVLQILTDNGSNYKKACQQISRDFPKIFWQPCAAHTINLLLKSIGKFTDVDRVISSAQRISKFFYSHNNLRAEMKHNIGGELYKWNATRFGTVYIFLQSFWDRKDKFRQWMASEEWTNSRYNEDPEYKYAEECLSCRKWWDNIKWVLEMVSPIYSLLRYADSQKLGTVSGFIPLVIIVRDLLEVYLAEDKYQKKVLALLDSRVKNMCQNTLMLAAAVLNLLGHYKFSISSNPDYLKELAIVIERIADSSASAVQALSEFQDFKANKGMFGLATARLAAESPNLTPANWWSLYGGDTKELQKYAVMIVSQCISTSGCESNWSGFSRVQTKLRNKLCYEKLHKLVYVNHNLKLRVQQLETTDREKEKLADPIQEMIDCALNDHANPIAEWLNDCDVVDQKSDKSLLSKRKRGEDKRKKGPVSENGEEKFAENESDSDDIETWNDSDSGADDKGYSEGDETDEDNATSSKMQQEIKDDETEHSGERNGTRPRRKCRNKTKDIHSLLGV